MGHEFTTFPERRRATVRACRRRFGSCSSPPSSRRSPRPGGSPTSRRRCRASCSTAATTCACSCPITHASTAPSPAARCPASALAIPIAGRTYEVTFRTVTVPGSGLDVTLVGNRQLFGRAGIYSPTPTSTCASPCSSGRRSRPASARASRPTSSMATTGRPRLLPLYLKTVYAWDRLFGRTRTRAHHPQHRLPGTFPAAVLPDDRAGRRPPPAPPGRPRRRAHQLPQHRAALRRRAHHGEPDLRARDPDREHGFGLDGLLRERAPTLVGILNGIDSRDWDPRDRPAPARQLVRARQPRAQGEQQAMPCSTRFGLLPAGRGPVARHRLAPGGAEGRRPALRVLPAFLASADVRFVVLGSGEPRSRTGSRRSSARSRGRSGSTAASARSSRT